MKIGELSKKEICGAWDCKPGSSTFLGGTSNWLENVPTKIYWKFLIFQSKMHFVCKIQWSISPCSQGGSTPWKCRHRNSDKEQLLLYMCARSPLQTISMYVSWQVGSWIPVLYLSHRFLGTVFKLLSQQWNRADFLRYFVLGKLPDFFNCFLKNRKKSDRWENFV